MYIRKRYRIVNANVESAKRQLYDTADKDGKSGRGLSLVLQLVLISLPVS